MPILERRMPGELAPLRDAIAQLQVAYAREAQSSSNRLRATRGSTTTPGTTPEQAKPVESRSRSRQRAATSRPRTGPSEVDCGCPAAERMPRRCARVHGASNSQKGGLWLGKVDVREAGCCREGCARSVRKQCSQTRSVCARGARKGVRREGGASRGEGAPRGGCAARGVRRKGVRREGRCAAREGAPRGEVRREGMHKYGCPQKGGVSVHAGTTLRTWMCRTGP